MVILAERIVDEVPGVKSQYHVSYPTVMQYLKTMTGLEKECKLFR